MKLLVLAIILLALPLSHAELMNWDTVILINDDKTSQWTVNLMYDEAVSKSDYFIAADISDYTVSGDGQTLSCSLSTGPGTLIACDSINAKNIIYSITTKELARDILQRFKLFTQKISATEPTRGFSVTVKLPLGAGLAEARTLQGTSLKPLEPEFGKRGSDGRRIFIEWRLDRPILGDTLHISIVYEQFSEEIQFGLFGFIVGVALVVFFIFIFVSKRRPVQSILPVLTPNERKVVEILLREKGAADQREIVRETDFSKAKASRIINDLVKRGVVEKASKGRKNTITLNKAVNTGKAGEQKHENKRTK